MPTPGRPSIASLQVIALPVATPIALGDRLAPAVLSALAASGQVLQSGDVLAVASKVVALSERAVVDSPPPGGAGTEDPRRAMARARSSRVVADADAALVVATHHGFVCANAGIDASNTDAGLVVLPTDPDRSARALRADLATATGATVAVVVTDTFGRPWRMGQTDVALGVAGMDPLRDERGMPDLHGNELSVTVAAVADEVAGAADLVRTKAGAVPFVLVRGMHARGTGSGRDLVRPLAQDLFPAGGPTMHDHAVAIRIPRHDPSPDRTAGHDGTASTRVRPRLLAHAGELATGDGITVTPAVGLDRLVVAVDDVAGNIPPATLLRAGMAIEDARIVLAGRGLGLEVLEPTSDDQPGTVAVLVVT